MGTMGVNEKLQTDGHSDPNTGQVTTLYTSHSYTHKNQAGEYEDVKDRKLA